MQYWSKERERFIQLKVVLIPFPKLYPKENDMLLQIPRFAINKMTHLGKEAWERKRDDHNIWK